MLDPDIPANMSMNDFLFSGGRSVVTGSSSLESSVGSLDSSAGLLIGLSFSFYK